MCGICGCSEAKNKHHTDTPQENELSAHTHDHFHPLEHTHQANQRLIEVEQDLLSRNDRFAFANRSFFSQHACLSINLVSSPGAGKTTLLVETIEALKSQSEIGVIEGDQQTDNDAKRITACGVTAHQINTGKGCHLDAHQIGHALEHFNMDQIELLFIENVGNLVCPAAFDLGEYAKVVVLSVAEGDDKPLKYPDMFKAASLMIINKLDLAPYVDFSIDRALAYARRINPEIECICLSAKTGESMEQWFDWLAKAQVAHASNCPSPQQTPQKTPQTYELTENEKQLT